LSGPRQRLAALAAELGGQTAAPVPRRSYERAFDDGATIELYTEATPYFARREDVELLAEDERRQYPPLPVPPSARRPSRTAAAARVPPVRAASLPPATPPETASAPERAVLDPELLEQDLQALRAMPAPAPAPSPSAPAAPPHQEAGPPRLDHEIFDQLRQGRASETLAAMKSASKGPTSPSHQVFDGLRGRLAQATTYDVGTFDVKRRFDDFDRRLMSERPRAPSPASMSSAQPPVETAAPSLPPYELREDLEQMRAAKAAGPPGEQEPGSSSGDAGAEYSSQQKEE
jgi:hypothetical protein